MAQATTTTDIWTAADLAARFGAIPLNRICWEPPPGLASEDDVVRFESEQNRLYELVSGVLVEKVMGTYEAYLAALLVQILGNFARRHKLGVVLGADGMLRLAPGLIRIPDVAFIAFSRWSHRDVTCQAIADLVPNLAVEVVSRGNTAEELDEKLDDYFRVGVQAVWYVFPEVQEVHVFRAPDEKVVLGQSNMLTTEEVLPGFSLNLTRLFADPSADDEADAIDDSEE